MNTWTILDKIEWRNLNGNRRIPIIRWWWFDCFQNIIIYFYKCCSVRICIHVNLKKVKLSSRYILNTHYLFYLEYTILFVLRIQWLCLLLKTPSKGISLVWHLIAFDGEHPVRKIGEIWTSLSLSLFPGSLWHEVLVIVKVLSIGRINQLPLWKLTGKVFEFFSKLCIFFRYEISCYCFIGHFKKYHYY